DLANVFAQNQTQYLQLIVYAYQDASVIAPAVEVNDLGIKVLGIEVASDIHYAFHTPERHIKASIVLEIYQRNGQYKCRALAETSCQ
ncbi:serine protease, partial [Salmonella enterica subsp. enterica]|nr:serine protease [Salmonella enterica subsp. enterica serovar Poona]